MTTLRHHTEPGALVLSVAGPLAATDIPMLCAEAAALLADVGSGVVIYDVALLGGAGLTAVDALMRLHLAARRHGLSVRIRDGSPELWNLLGFIGVSEHLTPDARPSPA